MECFGVDSPYFQTNKTSYMSKSGLGVRLKTARKAAGWTQPELSERTGIKQTTISKLERGEQKSSTEIPLLASVLGVPALWLSDGIGSMHLDAKSDNVNRATKSEDEIVLYQYADPRCAAGPFAGMMAKPKLDTVDVAGSTIRMLNVDQSDCIAFIQADASGGATLAVGDEAIIRSDQTSPKQHNGKLFAIYDGETVFVRRITTRTTGGYLVTCDNADKGRFPDEALSRSEAESLSIIGRLCWSSGEK